MVDAVTIAGVVAAFSRRLLLLLLLLLYQIRSWIGAIVVLE